MAVFPGFNEDTFPLILVRERGYIVIFNIKLKEYIKVLDIIYNSETTLCFLEKENNEFFFITQHMRDTMCKFVIPEDLIKAALGL